MSKSLSINEFLAMNDSQRAAWFAPTDEFGQTEADRAYWHEIGENEKRVEGKGRGQ